MLADSPPQAERRSRAGGGPLRILLFSPTADRMTGADRDWVNLANALEPDEATITWAGTRGTHLLRPFLAESVVRDLVDVGLVPFNYCIQENAYIPRSPWLWCKILADHLIRQRQPLSRALRLAAAEPFDVVVSNTAAVTIGSVVAARRGLPHIWFVKEILDDRVRACRVLARTIAAASRTVIVPSQAAARPFRGAARVIGDGCDLRLIEPAREANDRGATLRELNLPTDRPLVVQCGGLVWWKGQHITLEAWRLLAQAGGPPPCSLVLLGEGSDSKRAALAQMLDGLPDVWRSAVAFAVSLPDDFRILAASDLVLHPSVLPDPYPNAVREAMLLGKPVIASAEGGLLDMIRDGDTGVLVPAANAPALARALSQLLAHSDLRDHIGVAGRAHALEAFDISKQKSLFLRWLQP